MTTVESTESLQFPAVVAACDVLDDDVIFAVAATVVVVPLVMESWTRWVPELPDSSSSLD